VIFHAEAQRRRVRREKIQIGHAVPRESKTSTTAWFWANKYMFKNFFKKAKDERDIDQLIYDIAEYQRTKDYEILYKLMTETIFFCPVDSESIKNIPQGEKYITKSADKIKTYFVEMNGLKLIPFYTSNNDERLKTSYFEIDGIDALKMVLESKGISGLLIQNNKNSWVGFDEQKIRWILSKHKT
jgi:hypothetical protein